MYSKMVTSTAMSLRRSTYRGQNTVIVVITMSMSGQKRVTNNNNVTQVRICKGH